MTTIVVGFTNLGAPALALAATIRIRRTDTQALVVTDAAMTEQGEGAYSYAFAPVDGLDYSIRADGSAALPDSERYAFGSVSGTAEARLEVDVPAILADTAAIQPLVDVAVSTRASALALASVQADTDDIQTRLPAALVGGRMDSDVAVVQAGAIDAAAIATDAVDADALATDAIAEIAGYLEATGPNPHGTGAWDSTATVPPQTIRDAMKLAPTVGAPAAGSIDEHLDAIEADTSAGGAGPWTTATGFATTADVATLLAAIAALNDPTAAAIADAVWTEVLAAHEGVSGSTAEAVAVLRNRIRIDFAAGPPRELVVYAQDGATELYRSALTTTNGTEVLAFFGVQHERGVPV